mmetsp:Transcript_16065/g.43479  ORF Transcript_16065/g.43479 Transcript_16065/m.43479 type:complete len:171 (-) Transcript_16065:1947-2459(-)
MDSFFSSSWLLGHLPRAAIQREIRLPLLASTLPNARGTRITARIRGEATWCASIISSTTCLFNRSLGGFCGVGWERAREHHVRSRSNMHDALSKARDDASDPEITLVLIHTGKHVMRTLIMIMNTLLARTRCNFFVIIVVSLRRESVEALSVPILRAEQSRWEVESTVVH